MWAQNAAGDTEVISFEMVDNTTWRVQPWPLEGERLTLQCEGRRIQSTNFASEEDFRETMARAPTVRLVFTLLRSSVVG